MKIINNSFPILREAKVINTTDPEKLGRIQLKVYPELSEIKDEDCPWCFPHTGGVHGKSFNMPLVEQLISCVIWNRYWNEITYLPFNITNPREHLFDKWVEEQKPKIEDMETDPEEEHLLVEHLEDDYITFHDTKNMQHGFLHPSGTYFIINNDGNVWIQSVKKLTFHTKYSDNKEADLNLEIDSETGDVKFNTKGNIDETIEKNVTRIIKENRTETIEKNETREIKGDRKETISGNETRDITGNLTEKITGEGKYEYQQKYSVKAQIGTSTDGGMGSVVVKNQFASLLPDVIDSIIDALLTTVPTTLGSPVAQNFNPVLIAKLTPALVKLKLLIQ